MLLLLVCLVCTACIKSERRGHAHRREVCKRGRRYYPPMSMLEVAAEVRRCVACVLLGSQGG